MSKSSQSSPKKSKVITRTGKWKATFIDILGKTGNVTLAAEAANVGTDTAYAHRNADSPTYEPEFAKAWQRALEKAADILEAEARRRGFNGYDEPVFGSGGPGQGTVQVGTVRRYSDTLLIFLLKGARPEKYRDNYHLTQNNQQNNVVVNWNEFLKLSRGVLPPPDGVLSKPDGNGEVVEGDKGDAVL